MPETIAALQALRASTADLLLGLAAERWSDADVRAPSLCADWTRGHVLTHLARNADGITETLAGALRGAIVERYPDGWDARKAAIDAGAGRSVTDLLADVRDSAERLDRVLGAVADADAWSRATAEKRSAGDWVWWRWREVEIHRVDLAGAYTPDRWPPLFVTTLLPQAAATLADRAQESVRVRVVAEGSVGPDHVDAEWTTGAGERIDVEGPDWAVLAWLVGRADAVPGVALSAKPALKPWR